MFLMTKKSKPNHTAAFREVEKSLEAGIKLTPDIQKYIDKYEYERVRMAKSIEIEYGIDNVDSPLQVKNYFLKVVSRDDLEMCKKNKVVSFDKKSLKYLASKGYKAAKAIRECRVLISKIETLTKLKAFGGVKGLVKPKITRAKTNRISYEKPPLMSINKDMLWDIIIPRKAEYCLYSIDIKYQEPTILVNMLNIKALKELMIDEPDFYNAVFKLVFGRNCTQDERDEVKTAWNSMSYGAFKTTVVKECSLIDGGMIYDYFDKIPEYKNYKNRCKYLAKINKQSDVTYFGTEVEADEKGARLERILMDIPIQGTGADILALLIEKFKTDVERFNLGDKLRIYYTRHDELILECHKDLCNKLDVDKLLHTIFDHSVEGWSPFRIKVSQLTEVA